MERTSMIDTQFQKVDKSRVGSDKQASAILQKNFLDYAPISNISIVDKRSTIRNQFDQQSYTPGQDCQIRMGTGDSYVYGPNCYLSFTLRVTNTTGGPLTFGFGEAGALSLFQTAEIKSQTGNEMDRVEEVALYCAKTLRYTKSNDYFSTGVGTLIGYDNGANTSINIGAGPGTTTDVRFCVPMAHILPLFSYPGLLPSQGCIAGSVMRLTLASNQRGIFASGDGLTWVVNEIQLLTDELQLMDSFNKRLQILSAKRGPGLSLTYETWYHAGSSATQGAVEVQIANSVSRATRCFALCRPFNDVNGTAAQVIVADSNASADAITEYDIRLGSLRFPHQRCTVDTEQFANALVAFDTFDKECAVAFDEWGGAKQLIATSFERHHILQLSGISVNGHRLLRVNLSKLVANHQVDVFMSYVKFLNVHLDSQAVST